MTQKESDKYYINVAQLCAQNSYAEKLKVGAIIVKDNQIISDGFNGTPSGLSNECENKQCKTYLCCNTNAPSKIDANCKNCGSLDIHTKPEVLHAESNAILKCARYGKATYGSTLYITHSPCIECAKLIIQAGIKRVVYLEDYRKADGLLLLSKVGITIEKFDN
jgi:dCMP deaminase